MSSLVLDKTLLRRYCCSGWAFFVPYLLIYHLVYFEVLSIPSGQGIFYLIHFCHIFLLCYHAKFIKRHTAPHCALFWFGIYLIFLYTGAHLEFPRDPWTHFTQIFQWEYVENIKNAGEAHKFSSYFAWSFLGELDILHRRTGLDIYFAFLATLLCYQYVRLAKVLGFENKWARVCGLGTCFFLGHTSSFYTQFGLSGSMVQQIAVVVGLRAGIVACKKKKVKYFATLVPIYYLIAGSHLQGLLVLTMGLAGIFVWAIIREYRNKGLYLIITGLTFCLILYYVLCWIWLKDIPYLNATWGRIEHLKILYEGTFPIWRINPAIWNANDPINFPRMDYYLSYFFMSALGWIGIIEVIIASCIMLKNKALGFLCMAPVFTLLYPPAGFLIILLLGPESHMFYRFLFGIPSGFCLVWLARSISMSTNHKLSVCRKYFTPCNSAAVIILLSIPSHNYFYGKFHEILTPPDSKTELAMLDSVADRIRKHKFPRVITDAALGQLLQAHLGTKISNDRRTAIYQQSPGLPPIDVIARYLESDTQAAVLLLNEELLNKPYNSIYADLSIAYYPYTLNNILVPQYDLIAKMNDLNIPGLKSEMISPGYILYYRSSEAGVEIDDK